VVIDVNNVEVKSILNQFQSFVKIETVSFVEAELNKKTIIEALNDDRVKIKVFSDCISDVEFVGEKIVLPSFYTLNNESQKNLISVFEFVINKIKSIPPYNKENGILVDINKDNIKIIDNGSFFEKETILLYNLLTIQLCEKLKK